MPDVPDLEWSPFDEPSEPFWIDGNGVLTERSSLGDDEMVVHYDDVPASDITTLDGIPSTTPLRTVIDIAPTVDPAHLALIVRDCLDRRLFTREGAWRRLGQPDMAGRRGAELLRLVLARM